MPLLALPIPQIHMCVQEIGQKVIGVELNSHQGMAFGVYGFAHLWRARGYVHAQSYLTLYDPMNCIAHQAPLSMGFSRPEYWSGLPALLWVAISSSRGSSRPRDRTSISCIGGRSFTTLAIGKALGSKVVFPLFPRQWLELCPKKLANMYTCILGEASQHFHFF